MTHAFIAPGSRSTPLARAFVAHPQIESHVLHDERAAAFAALGHGVATGRPAVVMCTSGTAAAHFYAAVIEADLSAVPLIVCTADRPPELWGRGAPQTIDQTHLYGSRVRDFIEPGPPDDGEPSSWRTLARRMISSATGATPGPVHANLSFRDPLTGTADVLAPPMPSLALHEPPQPPAQIVADVVELIAGRRGVLIAGRNESSGDDVVELAARLRWPVIADHRSGCRDPEAIHVLRHFDALLRDSAFAAGHRPQVVLRVGEIVSSKATSQWLAGNGQGEVIATRPWGRNIDPEAIATLQVDEAGIVPAILRALPADADCDAEWLDSWTTADQAARDTIASELACLSEPDACEVVIAQRAIDAVPARGALVVSSSMPVRDVEWFGQHRNDVTFISNRGANGIDGVVATAIGVALSGLPTVCLIGDVAFLHDSTSLIGLRDRDIDLTIMVIHNNGGGIFSFLPQHDLLDPGEYELLFGTPHGTDLVALANAHGVEVGSWPATDLAPKGVRVVVAQTNRDENLVLHNRLNDAVARAIAAR